MKVGDLVREIPIEIYSREIGVIVRAANDALGFHLPGTRYWEILWTDGLQVMLDDNLEVISESR